MKLKISRKFDRRSLRELAAVAAICAWLSIAVAWSCHNLAVPSTYFLGICQFLCVNDLDFGVGFGFGFVVGVGFGFVVGVGFGFVVGVGFWFCCCCWFWGWSAGEGGLSPSLAYPRRRKPEIALCQSPWPGHALGPQHGEVI